MEIYGFRRMTARDLPAVNGWLRTPEVRVWWAEPDGSPPALWTAADLREAGVRRWIVSHAGRPFACLQDYDPHAWPGHHFGFLPPGARGTDQFIGVPEMIGFGHGRRFLRAFCDRLFAEGVPAVGTDPHPDNLRAIRASEHAGFTGSAVVETDWGRCRLMLRWHDAGPVAAPGGSL